MDLIQYLKTDDEMKNLRAKWKETFVTPGSVYWISSQLRTGWMVTLV